MDEAVKTMSSPRFRILLSFVMVLCFSAQGAPTGEIRRPYRTLGRVQIRIETASLARDVVVTAHPRSMTAVRWTQPQSSSDGAVRVRATGYCSCVKCCGKSNGITASGKPATWGTIAAPKGYTFGSVFFIPELGGSFTVRDRGGAIQGNRIDIWFPTHEQAIKWGVHTVSLIPVQ